MAKLVTAIDAYIAHHHIEPKPFIWTPSAGSLHSAVGTLQPGNGVDQHRVVAARQQWEHMKLFVLMVQRRCEVEVPEHVARR